MENAEWAPKMVRPPGLNFKSSITASVPDEKTTDTPMEEMMEFVEPPTLASTSTVSIPRHQLFCKDTLFSETRCNNWSIDTCFCKTCRGLSLGQGPRAMLTSQQPLDTDQQSDFTLTILLSGQSLTASLPKACR